MTNVPRSFIEKITTLHGSKGKEWLQKINDHILYSEARWNFQTLLPYELSYNYVAPVIFSDQSEGVLKVCFPEHDPNNEIQTLRVYAGTGMCKLIDSSPERGILLLEKIHPGRKLTSIPDETEAALIACGLIGKISAVSCNTPYPFPTIALWSEGLKKLRNHFHGGTGPFPEDLVRKAERLYPHLSETQTKKYLLHGDLHHENILSTPGGWKLIDPKGLIGEMEYELIPFLMNNLPENNMEKIIQERALLFSRELKLDVNRIYAWGLCHSLLSSWWDIEDHLGFREDSLRIINIFNGLTPFMGV